MHTFMLGRRRVLGEKNNDMTNFWKNREKTNLVHFLKHQMQVLLREGSCASVAAKFISERALIIIFKSCLHNKIL